MGRTSSRRHNLLGLVLLLGLALLLGACGTSSDAAETPGQPGETTQPSQDNPSSVPFHLADMDMQQLDELHGQPAGAYWVTQNDAVYLVVTAGQQPTAGYTVQVDTVTNDGTTLTVHAKLEGPGPGEMVAQVITYPMAVLVIPDESLHHRPVTVEWISDEDSDEQ